MTCVTVCIVPGYSPAARRGCRAVEDRSAHLDAPSVTEVPVSSPEQGAAAPHVVAVVGSPQPGGRSLTAARGLLDGCEAAGATTRVLELAQRVDPEWLQLALEQADGIVFATPTYRAGPSALLRSLFEQTQRGAEGETRAPLLGKATAIVHTGAAPHHYLAVDQLRSLLAGFYAAQVLSPGLYLDDSHFVDAGPSEETGRPRVLLTDDARELTDAHGRAFAEFAAAVRASPAIGALIPQI